MMNPGGKANANDEEASQQALDALRALGFTGRWPLDYKPTWADLRGLEAPYEPIAYECVDDSTLEYLRYTPNVKCLNLRSTQITDKGMAAMCYVPQLERLLISNTRISDEGISQLLSHKNLKVVEAFHARVTIVGERLLQSSVPGCHAIIGRTLRRGIVVAAEGNVLTVDILDSTDRITAIVPDNRLEELSDLLIAPLGQWVVVQMGEAEEPNKVMRVTNAPEPPWIANE